MLYKPFASYYFRLTVYIIIFIAVVILADPLDVVLLFDGPAMDGEHPALESQLVAGQT